MVVECRNGHKNRIPDRPETNKAYHCGRCKVEIHVVWPDTPIATIGSGEGAGGGVREPDPPSKVPAIVTVILLLCTVSRKWPYGFYTILRVVASGSAVYLAAGSNKLDKKPWVWLMGATAIVFNPIVPVRLDRSMWIYLDLAAALLFAASLLFVRSSSSVRR